MDIIQENQTEERKNPFSLNDTTYKRIIGIHKTPDIRSVNVGDSEKSTNRLSWKAYGKMTN